MVFPSVPTTLAWLACATPSSQPVAFAATAAVPLPLSVCRVVILLLSPAMICLQTSFLRLNITFFILLSRMLTTARSPLFAAFSTALSTIG